MFRRNLTSRTLFISLIAALGFGCAPGNPGMVVAGVAAPDDQGAYEFNNPTIGTAIFDVGFPNNTYVAVLKVTNQLLNLSNNGTSGVPTADPNVIQPYEAEIELRDTAGAPFALGALPNPFRVPVGGQLIESSDGTQPGQGLAAVEVIPAVYADAFLGSAGTTVVASITLIGRTAGDAEVVALEYIWPIQICSGCLQSCQLDTEGVPICSPSPTPGQDLVETSCDGLGIMIPGSDPPAFYSCFGNIP